MKMLTLTVLFVVSASIMISCSETKKEEVADNMNTALSNTAASANTTAETTEASEETVETKVFAISAVSKAVKGKSVDFTWQEDGKDISFAEITKGKVVLLNFWGTWCPPCRMEIPDLIKINTDLTDKDFIMIGIALERNPAAALKKVESFAKAQKMPYYLFIDETNDIVKEYGGINAVPTTYIIDKEGNISETIVGLRDYDGFMDAIKRVL